MIQESPELYQAAANYIERNGWTTGALKGAGTFDHPDGPVCILGACYYALTPEQRKALNDDEESAYSIANAFLALHRLIKAIPGADYACDPIGTNDGRRLWSWNDRMGSKRKAVRLLRRAARNVRVQQWRSARKAAK